MSEINRKIRACAEWLSYCLSIGWKRRDLDALEKLWWKQWRKRTLPSGYIANIEAWRNAEKAEQP